MRINEHPTVSHQVISESAAVNDTYNEQYAAERQVFTLSQMVFHVVSNICKPVIIPGFTALDDGAVTGSEPKSDVSRFTTAD